MKWYYEQRGEHTHVRVFVNGANCGHLVFRNGEFEEIFKRNVRIEFLSEQELRDEDQQDIVEQMGNCWP